MIDPQAARGDFGGLFYGKYPAICFGSNNCRVFRDGKIEVANLPYSRYGGSSVMLSADTMWVFGGGKSKYISNGQGNILNLEQGFCKRSS